MNPESSNAEGKSFRNRSKEILRHPFKEFKALRSSNRNDNNAIDQAGSSNSATSSAQILSTTGLVESDHEPESSSSQRDSRIRFEPRPHVPENESSEAPSKMKVATRGDPPNCYSSIQRSSAVDISLPEFLTRSPDPNWIDIEMIGYWLQKCDREHGDRCCRPFGLDMLELGKANLLIDVERKCLTAAKSEYRYACLNYVWGGAETLKTRKDNIDRLMKDKSLISRWDEIPRTIRDAIGIVNQLGLRYIWVDSLCILQDDEESKHDQIQAMAGIYANAYVTIIAGNGWDADHGLRGIQGVTEPRQLSSFLKHDFTESLQPYSSIWYTRGWTFQEMIFSPRKIMFQYQLAIWECNNSSWHETSLSNVQHPLSDSLYQPKINPWKSDVKFSRWPNIEQYIHLANDYCTRKLTYADDSLPAISSLLSVMSYSFPGGFISGLPQMFFDEGLLWQPAEPLQRRKSSCGNVILPSWSWTGWEGEIMTKKWENHWSHLHLNRLHGRRLNRSESVWYGIPILPVVPKVKWYYGNTLKERLTMNSTSREYIEHLANRALQLPPNWSHHHLNPNIYYLDKDPRTHSIYPLPTSLDGFVRPISVRYLFCRTSRGYLKKGGTSSYGYLGPGQALSTVILEDEDSKRIGHLGFDSGFVVEPPDGMEFELVVISAGSLTSRNLNFAQDGVEIPPGIGWGHFTDAWIGVEPVDVVEFYYVLWIAWENGIAHRKGLGRVTKKAVSKFPGLFFSGSHCLRVQCLFGMSPELWFIKENIEILEAPKISLSSDADSGTLQWDHQNTDEIDLVLG